MNNAPKSIWLLSPEAKRNRRARVPEPPDYSRLQTFELVGHYRVALFTSAQARLFCAPREGVNLSTIELRLRPIDGTLTCRLSLGNGPQHPRRKRHKSQVTTTVARLLAAKFGPSDCALISLEGTCATRSLWWVPRGDSTVVSRCARGYDLSVEKVRDGFAHVMRDLGATPFVLPAALAAGVALNDQIDGESRA